MKRSQLNAIIAHIEPEVTSIGYCCLDVEWDADQTLRVYIDHQNDDVVDVNDCVKVNGVLSKLDSLDEIISGAYTLEISSPGIQRPLRLAEDFRSHIGEVVEAKLEAKFDDRLYGKGELKAVSEGGEVTIETSRGEWIFPLSVLLKASLIKSV